MSDALVIIPTYNEKENIEGIIRATFNEKKSFIFWLSMTTPLMEPQK